MNLQKYTDIDIKLNRLRSQKSALQNKLKSQNNQERKARTRTLIQMGGLLNLTPMPSACDIELGDDLQLDYPDNAAVLLGMLTDFANKIPDFLSDEDRGKFRKIGVNIMKKNA
jgi:hypothetical protein